MFLTSLWTKKSTKIVLAQPVESSNLSDGRVVLISHQQLSENITK